MKNWLILSAVFVLFACSAKDRSYNYPHNPDYTGKARAGKLFSSSAQDLIIFGNNNAKNVTDVKNNLENSTLWKVAQLVIGEIAPISSADIDGGLIASQWYQESENERVKINAEIKGFAAKKENLQITILRQKKFVVSGKFEWKNVANTDSDAALAKSIQDKILQKSAVGG